MSNLAIYEQARSVPKDAQRPIKGGRLKGLTDINPMWRIKKLTELFGVCGIGWKYVIVDKRLEPAPGGEITAFVDIDLYINQNGKWSEGIPGTGGSMFVASERNGLYVSDECFKMALTDAISVSCKMLGVGADIYWNSDSNKYNEAKAEPQKDEKSQDLEKLEAITVVAKVAESKGWSQGTINSGIKKYFPGKTKLEQLTLAELHKLINRINASGGDGDKS